MRLILDINVPTAVARGLQAVGIDVIAAATWNDGDIRTADDTDILNVATAENRVLVTYGTKTFRPLGAAWAERELHHAGIIFIDDRTFRQNDIDGIVRALRTLATERGHEDWHDRMEYLKR